MSSPALTELDLLRNPQACGELDHVAKLLTELAYRISPEQLVLL